MNAETLSASAGILLSLVFSYVPNVKDWYAKRDGTVKRLLMLAALLITAIAIYVLSCIGYLAMVSCDKAGAITLIKLLISALIANQAAFLVSPKYKP